MKDAEKKYVPNDVFRFSIYLGIKMEDITVYTKPFPEYEPYELCEQIVKDKYFTQERINELKENLIKKIRETENPFDIICSDTDSGYNVTEEELFKL